MAVTPGRDGERELRVTCDGLLVQDHLLDLKLNVEAIQAVAGKPDRGSSTWCLV